MARHDDVVPPVAGAHLRGIGVIMILAVTSVIGLAAFGKPLHPSKWKTSPDEIPEGAGRFTGEDGEWNILGDN